MPHSYIDQQNRGLLSALSAYCMWGLLPLYWKALGAVPSHEIICHRIVWSVLITFSLLVSRGKLVSLLKSLANKRVLITFFCTSTLLGTNWLIYIWAVNNGYIVESSLGYFINPLIAVLLGVFFLKEQLRPGQWASLTVATIGVLYLTFSYGSFPWIGLSLACTFGLYSLLRKTSCLHSLQGLFCDTALLAIPAIITLIVLSRQGNAHFLSSGSQTTMLLIGSGIITSLPLLLFVYGAQRITMTALGIMQYLAPTLQFMIGLFVYHEPFPLEKLIGFSFIWLALILYTTENIFFTLQQRKRIRKQAQIA